MLIYSEVYFDSGKAMNCLKLINDSLKLSNTNSVSPFQKVARQVNLGSCCSPIDFLNIANAS